MIEICPVCKGRGTVPPGFYLKNDFTSTVVTNNPEICRSCNGKGYIAYGNPTGNTTIDQYPCNHCNVGWESISTTGITSCRDSCLRLRNYRHKSQSVMYCTPKLVWVHANMTSELPEPTELRSKYSDNDYVVMAKVGFRNPQNQYEIYILTSNDMWIKLEDFHDITTYKFEGD